MGSKILVAGSHADNLGYQCGGWTIGWQGFSGNGNTTGMLIVWPKYRVPSTRILKLPFHLLPLEVVKWAGWANF